MGRVQLGFIVASAGPTPALIGLCSFCCVRFRGEPNDSPNLRFRADMGLPLLRLWPCSAAGVPERFQYTAVEAAQDATHEIQRAIIGEIGTMNCRAIDLRRKKTGTIYVPHIVCRRGRVRQWRPSRKPAAAQASHDEVF